MKNAIQFNYEVQTWHIRLVSPRGFPLPPPHYHLHPACLPTTISASFWGVRIILLI